MGYWGNQTISTTANRYYEVIVTPVGQVTVEVRGQNSIYVTDGMCQGRDRIPSTVDGERLFLCWYFSRQSVGEPWKRTQHEPFGTGCSVTRAIECRRSWQDPTIVYRYGDGVEGEEIRDKVTKLVMPDILKWLNKHEDILTQAELNHLSKKLNELKDTADRRRNEYQEFMAKNQKEQDAIQECLDKIPSLWRPM